MREDTPNPYEPPAAASVPAPASRLLKAARYIQLMAMAVTVLTVVNIALGVLAIAMFSSDSSLSGADRQRMLASGIESMLFNGALGVIVAVPLFGAAAWLRRRARPRLPPNNGARSAPIKARGPR